MVATGFGNATVTCDGTNQRVKVVATAENLTFKNGTAVVTADINICGPFIDCQGATDTKVIKIIS